LSIGYFAIADSAAGICVGCIEESAFAGMPSRYNLVYRINDTDTYFVFNCLRRSAAIVPGYFNLSSRPLEFSEQTAPHRAKLRELGMLVPDARQERDELVAKVAFERFPGHGFLSLTILPTLNCPLYCPYCYQGSDKAIYHRHGSMKADVEEALLKFAEANLVGRAGLAVSWYGGEPLLRWKQFTRLSGKLVAVVEEAQKRYSATMVTSGWGLSDKRTRELAEKHRITSLQITLEMPPARHAERRLGPKGQNILRHLVEVVAAASKYLTVNLRLNLEAGGFFAETAHEKKFFL